MTPLENHQPRARWMRFGTAQMLKRFHFCERSLIVSCSAWLPLISNMDAKTLLPAFSWQNAKTAQDLRERVFELRYPNRDMDEEGADRSLIAVFDELRNSPSCLAFFIALSKVLLPAVRDAYEAYLRHADPLADAPTLRFVNLAYTEKLEQIRLVTAWAEEELTKHQDHQAAAEEWASVMRERLSVMGGVGTDQAPPELSAIPLPGGQPYSVPVHPSRDQRYHATRFYWPDNVDPSLPYGEGNRLQLRSAVSHLNEAWAVETGGIILSSFASTLPWDWIHDSARWTYDESRHCRMGRDRLAFWGYEPEELPLGTFIYDSAADQDPIYRLGMLFFFETKNIGHKPERVKAFQAIGDTTSEHDMDFDWADETMHAGFGRKWLQKIMEFRGEDPSKFKEIREQCSQMVQDVVKTATWEETNELRILVDAIIAKSESVTELAHA